MQAHHAERRGLTDDHVAGRDSGLARGREPPRAEGADLFVVGQQQRERPPERVRPSRGHPVDGEREKPFHVRGAAADVGVARPGEGEGWRVPLRLFRRDDVHVSRERQAVPVPGRGAGHANRLALVPSSEQSRSTRMPGRSR